MTQQQHERQVQTNPIPPLTPGFAEPSIFVRQRVFLHLDTPSSDHQGEVIPEEEVEEDSQEEVILVEAAASQVEEDQEDQEDQEDLQQIPKEDIKETD